MLNLLPKDQKKKIVREYLIRFFVVALALAFVGEIISLILLFPPYLTAETRVSILNNQSAGVKAQNITAETANLGNTIQQTSDYLNIFTSSTTPTGTVEVIKKVVDARGTAVQINSLVYVVQNGEQQIVVAGTAKSRQTLLDFVNRLKIVPGVASANLPVSDFAKAQNIDFSLMILMNPKHL